MSVAASPLRCALARCLWFRDEAAYTAWRLRDEQLHPRARVLLELIATCRQHDEDERLAAILLQARSRRLMKDLTVIAALPLEELLADEVEDLVVAVRTPRPKCPYGWSPDELLEAIGPSWEGTSDRERDVPRPRSARVA